MSLRVWVGHHFPTALITSAQMASFFKKRGKTARAKCKKTVKNGQKRRQNHCLGQRGNGLKRRPLSDLVQNEDFI